jgi:PKD repeat protein
MKSSSEGLIRNTTVKQNLITVTGTPVPALAANFTAIPLSGPAPLAVTFADSSTGSPDYWNYDFGDGTTSPEKNSTHTYRAPGTYTVTLTVMKISSEGLIRNTTIKQNLITVTGSPVPALAANFTAAPLSGPVPLKVTFTDTSTGNPQFWNYEFGDGTSSTSKNPSHTYLLPGNYTVTLTVIRPEGSTLLRNSTTRQNLIRAG